MKTAVVNGIQIHSFNNEGDLLEYINDQKKILVAINAEKIVKADARLKGLINRNIGYTDGIGAVMAMRRKGFRQTLKIAGCELWLHIIKRFHSEKTFYIIGGANDVIENTVIKLKQEYPDIRILSYRDGYLDVQAIEVLKQDLAAKKPDVVFVGMGSPKQEYLMEELMGIHPALYQGLGGSFDVYTGKVERAPRFFVNMGAEWLYRLLKQPTRFKRQLKLVNFAWLLLWNKL